MVIHFVGKKVGLLFFIGLDSIDGFPYSAALLKKIVNKFRF
jgi:hypothetical protein